MSSILYEFGYKTSFYREIKVHGSGKFEEYRDVASKSHSKISARISLFACDSRFEFDKEISNNTRDDSKSGIFNDDDLPF